MNDITISGRLIAALNAPVSEISDVVFEHRIGPEVVRLIEYTIDETGARVTLSKTTDADGVTLAEAIIDGHREWAQTWTLRPDKIDLWTQRPVDALIYGAWSQQFNMVKVVADLMEKSAISGPDPSGPPAGDNRAAGGLW